MFTASQKHTEAMQAIVTKVPSWIVRWGIAIFFGILLMVIVVSAIFKYPDVINVNVMMKSTSISYRVRSKASGTVLKVFAHQGKVVKKDELLATIITTDGVRLIDLIAPAPGNLHFITNLQSGEILQTNEAIAIIHPFKEDYYGIIDVSAKEVRKIKIGQQVIIDLSDIMPGNEVRLKGTISFVADEPADDGRFRLNATINWSSLPQAGIIYNGMNVKAKIITKNLSIFDRIMKTVTFRAINQM